MPKFKSPLCGKQYTISTIKQNIHVRGVQYTQIIFDLYYIDNKDSKNRKGINSWIYGNKSDKNRI